MAIETDEVGTRGVVLGHLAREGITTMEDLADRLRADVERTGASAEEILYGRPVTQQAEHAVPQARTWPLTGRYRHRPLQVPVLLDDRTTVDPGDTGPFDGLALDFVLEDDATGTVRAFSVEREAVEYMRARPVPTGPDAARSPAGDGTAQKHHAGGVAAAFFVHVHFTGAALHLDLAHVHPDLTQNHLAGILWWWTSWNDQISSVRAGSGWVTLWEHVYPATFGYPPGSKLHVAPFGAVADLVPLGWNDRVSAINHHYFAE
jgi:hypothetical protein